MSVGQSLSVSVCLCVCVSVCVCVSLSPSPTSFLSHSPSLRFRLPPSPPSITPFFLLAIGSGQAKTEANQSQYEEWEHFSPLPPVYASITCFDQHESLCIAGQCSFCSDFQPARHPPFTDKIAKGKTLTDTFLLQK